MRMAAMHLALAIVFTATAAASADGQQPPTQAALEALVRDYCKAWSEPDPGRRLALLERVWAEDGTYTDPTAHVAGRRELAMHIGKVFEQFPGIQLIATSAADTHHGKIRFGWRALLADGKILTEGTDFGELSSDGKLQRIVGFFGPIPPKP